MSTRNLFPHLSVLINSIYNLQGLDGTQWYQDPTSAETYQILCFYRVQDQDGLFIKADTV